MSAANIDVENLEAQLKKERKKVDVSVLNFSVRELVRMMTENELNVSPEYQRMFRWDTQKESVFVESVFLGLPVPPIFVATNDDYRWEVVDGLQRLSTLVHFVAEGETIQRLVNRRDPLRLDPLEKIPEFTGLQYSEIPQALRLYFGRQPLQVVSLTDKSDKQVRFDLFERLNGGSIALSPQEVRACVFRGEFNSFVDRLSRDQRFAGLIKLQQSKQNDGTMAEQVLKFFAYRNYAEKFDGRVTHFLNQYMEYVDEKGMDYDAAEKVFFESCNLLRDAIGAGPYLRKDYGVTPLVQFEASLVAASRLVDKGIHQNQAPVDWVNDSELKSASMGGTNTRSMLNRRLQRAEDLLDGTYE